MGIETLQKCYKNKVLGRQPQRSPEDRVVTRTEEFSSSELLEKELGMDKSTVAMQADIVVETTRNTSQEQAVVDDGREQVFVEQQVGVMKGKTGINHGQEEEGNEEKELKSSVYQL